MPRVKTINSARIEHKDSFTGETINIGDTYHRWEFNYGSVCKSKTYPKPSQLTRSEFKGQIGDIGERISQIDDEWDVDAVKETIEQVCQEIEEMSDKCQESMDNLPENFQETSYTWELLQNRIDELESYKGELESAVEEDTVEDIINQLNSCSYDGE